MMCGLHILIQTTINIREHTSYAGIMYFDGENISSAFKKEREFDQKLTRAFPPYGITSQNHVFYTLNTSNVASRMDRENGLELSESQQNRADLMD
jgi:hypothetical protein